MAITGTLQPEARRKQRARYAVVVLHTALGTRDAARLGAAIAASLAASVLAAAAPVSLKYLLESIGGGSPAQPPSAQGLSPVIWLAAYIGALLFGRLAGEARSVLFGTAEQSISRNLSRKAFAHVIALPMRFHLSRSTGAVVQTLENGLQGYRLILHHSLFTLLPGLVEIVLIGALILHYFNPVFLLVFGASAAAYGFVFASGARQLLRASREVSAARIEANARLSDGLLNFETVKAFCGEAAITSRYDARLSETQARWRRFYQARFANGLFVALVFSASLGVSLWMASGMVQAGAMTIGDFVLVNVWMLQLVRPLELLGFGIRDIGQGAAFVERFNGLLLEVPEERAVVSFSESVKPARPPSIRFENVSFSYDGARKVLDNISFEIAAGTRTALVGPSGSGKSSIIRLLMRFYEPDEGRITIDGIDIGDFPPAEIRKLIAMVPQDTALFNESLAFNMAFPDELADTSDIDWAAQKVILDDLISGLPGGYATLAGERGLKLSGGEKQRVAIARALLRRARVFLADEATSAVDYRTEAMISGSGAFAAEGVTSVIVAHRLASIAHADDIIVLVAGRIVERGRHTELCGARGLYADMWRAQSERPSQT